MPTYRSLVQYTYGQGGGPGYSGFHFRTDGDLIGDELQAATDALAAFYAAVEPVMATGTVVSSDGTWVDVEDDEETVGLGWSNPVAGSSLTLPMANCLVLGWRTSSRTRSGRGRTFLGPLSAGSALQNGTPDPSDCALIEQSARTHLLTPFAGSNNGSFGVFSPTQGVMRDVTAFQVRPVFAVLRSRRD